MLKVIVHDIKGNCPVHKVGDRILIKNPNIVLQSTDALCTHALPTILHYALILEYNWCPLKLGLTKEQDLDHAYFQCLDPGQPYTRGGTVIFRVEKPDRHSAPLS
jgi:uncharacterized repeat protein (TIGR04076 family)